ncbi:MAG: hypothetical protein GIW99_10095 [Candidatus Eremiobacteraeota bacterium]|nr:hypothetical protein [Candidatus Eremiobacteraeota bacterium]MBC5828014.1 hypothetical protein [Candidatus Eremiobacteraeota bacterium]
MAEQIWERVDPLINRWKKFTSGADAVRLAAVEHSPTSELQRLIKEFDEVQNDVAAAIERLEETYGVAETGDIGADLSPPPDQSHRHRSLVALRSACAEAAEEVADRERAGEV